MSKNGEASMSGGFAFGKEIGSITSDKLLKTNKREKRRFWFFMDNSSGASRGIYFNSYVNRKPFLGYLIHIYVFRV